MELSKAIRTGALGEDSAGPQASGKRDLPCAQYKDTPRTGYLFFFLIALSLMLVKPSQVEGRKMRACRISPPRTSMLGTSPQERLLRPGGGSQNSSRPDSYQSFSGSVVHMPKTGEDHLRGWFGCEYIYRKQSFPLCLRSTGSCTKEGITSTSTQGRSLLSPYSSAGHACPCPVSRPAKVNIVSRSYYQHRRYHHAQGACSSIYVCYTFTRPRAVKRMVAVTSFLEGLDSCATCLQGE